MTRVIHVPGCTSGTCLGCTGPDPKPEAWPGVEGYCADCNMIVAVDVNGNKQRHAGTFTDKFSTSGCAGSGAVPEELPDNLIDPWVNDERGEEKDNAPMPSEA